MKQAPFYLAGNYYEKALRFGKKRMRFSQPGGKRKNVSVCLHRKDRATQPLEGEAFKLQSNGHIPRKNL